MDWGNILYIIALIVYAIYSASKSKKKKQNPTQTSPRGQTRKKASKDITFEELLKEIRAEKTSKEISSPRVELEKLPEETPSKKTTLKPFKEKSAALPESRTFHSEEKKKPLPIPSYTEVEDFDDAYARMKKEEERIAKVAASIPSQKDIYTQARKSKVNRYATRLKNKNSVREAIVLNEILKRRHF